MATIQLGNTKVASKLISYAEKRAEERSGIDCPPEYAKAQFKATRELWGKTDGIQAHHIIQSFKPGEVSPEQANEIGRELASGLAKGHEVAIYTHADKEHIHNHIVINAVSYEDGKKYQLHGKEAIEKVREASDHLCLERGLSVVEEPSAEVRYTLAEKSLVEKGKDSWKDEIRQIIDHVKGNVQSLEELADKLKKYGVETKITPKNISFKHPDYERFVRGTKLGLAYEKETLKNGFERLIERGQERGSTQSSSEAGDSDPRTDRIIEADPRIEQHHERVHQHPLGQAGHGQDDDRQRVDADQRNQSESPTGDDLYLAAAREALRSEQTSIKKGFTNWTNRDESEQRSDRSAAQVDSPHRRPSSERDSNKDRPGLQGNQKEHGERDQQHKQGESKRLQRSRREEQELDIER
ncbi:relaxase/mobilization nuclease domain-containing protein [Metabacillus idriensis]|uniref:relaxase/mobilization nuclease domain-containing protein n=1 Tax=Metabacillus idriensis TaxID=324768 RepID=UPI0017498114|nr:relaxase/mobilization nuclease domain-containing protein [Metabacillus idriensis]